MHGNITLPVLQTPATTIVQHGFFVPKVLHYTVTLDCEKCKAAMTPPWHARRWHDVRAVSIRDNWKAQGNAELPLQTTTRVQLRRVQTPTHIQSEFPWQPFPGNRCHSHSLQEGAPCIMQIERPAITFQVELSVKCCAFPSRGRERTGEPGRGQPVGSSTHFPVLPRHSVRLSDVLVAIAEGANSMDRR